MNDRELEAIERRLARTKGRIRPGDRPRTWIVDQERLLAEVRALRAQLDAVVAERDAKAEELHELENWVEVTR